MKLGVIHYPFREFSLEQFLDYCQDAGFGYVELQCRDVWKEEESDDPEANAEKVLKLVENRGLKLSALASGNDFVVLDEETVKFQVERMKRVCGLAKILGTNTIRTEGGQPKDSVPEEKWVEAMGGCFQRCVEFAEEMDINFAVDNHGLCTNDGDRQLKLIQMVGSKRVGVNLDTMNYRWFGHEIPTINRFYEILAPHTFHTHLKDGTGARPNYVGAALGEGEIDLAHAVKCLKEAGYEGVWCAECEAAEPSDVAYRRCLQWMKTNL
ncbi:MAG: hypothetical protein AUJ92_08290 [Armatimonadetes bacterium CG2_30_59_28]|nr:sugar phosphate isomerase/epimerase [Armatimonadota bacterium]OIO95233.1 MAG: hypothetical protein AUJ92_08290 [Armatimonadetes bacterium CG2_30_59_28]PIU66965.1 MAG: hypothetical protein COS85_02495 [Armatimonadetes bacterium CG07_land_8_20_14_0_80_59_28]PIX41651.1 MAG: hypothetical protein COZ56_11365 [Armatimonadetes bacterium CG_4_8_14_3_um_filter_58_9]PIY43761.1 MAG: hypothetical protein COZ05_10095 [Armatimonadetes bacterium CG_4_10_14_3_um_filter_59_10]PJB67957.1 MAG: hypothetical pr